MGKYRGISEQYAGAGSSPQYVQMQGEPPVSGSFSHRPEIEQIFHELPRATIVDVTRSDLNELSHIQLVYIIEIEYKQFKWRLVKKASQVFYLHFALKKRVFIEELHEKQEQVKEWLQSIGIGEHTGEVEEGHDEDDHDEEEIHPSKSRISSHMEVTVWHFLAQRCSFYCSIACISTGIGTLRVCCR